MDARKALQKYNLSAAAIFQSERHLYQVLLAVSHSHPPVPRIPSISLLIVYPFPHTHTPHAFWSLGRQASTTFPIIDN